MEDVLWPTPEIEGEVAMRLHTKLLPPCWLNFLRICDKKLSIFPILRVQEHQSYTLRTQSTRDYLDAISNVRYIDPVSP